MHQVIPDELLELTARKFQMLGDPTRLAILRVLMGGERSVGQVVEETGRGHANVSKHLKMLAESGLVRRRKEGLQVFYSVGDPLVENLCKLVCASILRQVEDSVSRNQALLNQVEPRRARAGRVR